MNLKLLPDAQIDQPLATETHNSHMSQFVEDNSHLYAQLKLHGPWIDCTVSRKPAPEKL